MFCLAGMLKKSDGSQPDFLKRINADDYEKFLHSMQTLKSIDLLAAATDMTPSELAVIHCAITYPLNNNGEYVTVAQTAANLNVSMPAVSRTLKALQAKGYIERRTDESDRRSVRIVATSSGTDVFTRNIERSTEMMDRILSGFSDDELNTIIRLHCKFTSLLSEEITNVKTDRRKENI